MTLTKEEQRDLNTVYRLIYVLKDSPRLSADLRFDLMTFSKALDRDLYGEK